MTLEQVHAQVLRTYVHMAKKFDNKDTKSRDFNDLIEFR